MTGVKLHWISVRERWLIRNGEASEKGARVAVDFSRLHSAPLGSTRLDSGRLGIRRCPICPPRRSIRLERTREVRAPLEKNRGKLTTLRKIERGLNVEICTRRW